MNGGRCRRRLRRLRRREWTDGVFKCVACKTKQSSDTITIITHMQPKEKYAVTENIERFFMRSVFILFVTCYSY